MKQEGHSLYSGVYRRLNDPSILNAVAGVISIILIIAAITHRFIMVLPIFVMKSILITFLLYVPIRLYSLHLENKRRMQPRELIGIYYVCSVGTIIMIHVYLLEFPKFIEDSLFSTAMSCLFITCYLEYKKYGVSLFTKIYGIVYGLLLYLIFEEPVVSVFISIFTLVVLHFIQAKYFKTVNV